MQHGLPLGETNEVDSPVYGCNGDAVIVRRMGFRLTPRNVKFMSQPLYKHLTGGEALMSPTWRVVGCAALNDLWDRRLDNSLPS